MVCNFRLCLRKSLPDYDIPVRTGTGGQAGLPLPVRQAHFSES